VSAVLAGPRGGVVSEIPITPALELPEKSVLRVAPLEPPLLTKMPLPAVAVSAKVVVPGPDMLNGAG